MKTIRDLLYFLDGAGIILTDEDEAEAELAEQGYSLNSELNLEEEKTG